MGSSNLFGMNDVPEPPQLLVSIYPRNNDVSKPSKKDAQTCATYEINPIDLRI